MNNGEKLSWLELLKVLIQEGEDMCWICLKVCLRSQKRRKEIIQGKDSVCIEAGIREMILETFRLVLGGRGAEWSVLWNRESLQDFILLPRLKTTQRRHVWTY